MKKIFSIFGALLAGAMMFSCADQYEEGTPLGTELSVTPEAITEVAGQDAEAITLNVTSNGLWIAQATEWITVEPMTGEGNATVTVTVADNMDPKAPAELDAPRKGTITFAVGKDNVVVVEVAQLGDPTKAAMKLPYTETFAESQGRFKIEDVKLPEGSTYVWKHDSYNGVCYMKASAYVGGYKPAESYLVSPVIDLTEETKAVFSFEHAGKFFGDLEAEAQVWVREEGAEKWAEQLEFTHMATQDYTFYNSGEISLEEYVGKKIQIGWRYVSTDAAAGTWEVNNVKFYDPDKTEEGGEEPEEPEEPEDPETPEDPEDPEVTLVAATIAEVLAIEQDKPIGDKYIEGIVISNRALSNLTSKKGMYIQDETAGLQLRLTNDHEINFGDKVKINLSGVNMGAYNGAVQVSVDNSKVEVISSENAVEAKTVTMADFLANKYEGQYIALEGVQVVAADLAKTWGDETQNSHISINMEDAEGNNFVVFSSKYATYAAETVAQGSGTIKGISSISKGAVQIIFAQATDYAGLTGERFGSAGGETPEEPEEPEEPVELAGTGEGTLESPYDVVRAKAAIDAYTTVDGVYVKGVVTTSEIKFNSTYSSCDYYISVDGTTENELQVYSGKFVDGADFTSADQIHAGDEVVVCGDLKKHYETYEFNYSSKIVSLTCNHETTEPEEPEDPEQPEGGRLYWGHDDFGAIATAVGQEELNASVLANITATADLTVNADGITYKGLELLLGSSGKFKMKTNQSIADPEGDKENRVQFGGGGSTTKQVMIFEVPAAGTLKIDAVSSSDSESRPLKVNVDGTEIATFDTVMAKQETTGEIFTVDCSTAKAGSKIYLYSGKSGINVFSIEYTY